MLFLKTQTAMIKSFADSDTEDVFHGIRVKGWSKELQVSAMRRLHMLDFAETLSDLRVPPGNRLEALRGDMLGHYSIRINQQWRITFVWDQGAEQVRIVDYH